MKTKQKLLFTVSIFCLACFSCTDEGPEKITCGKSTIVDEWIWLRHEGGVGGLYLTPENTGWNIRLEVGDSIWREFKNDTLTFESAYTFTPDTTDSFGGGQLHFAEGYGTSVSMHDCFMSLNVGYEDTPTSYYQRKQ